MPLPIAAAREALRKAEHSKEVDVQGPQRKSLAEVEETNCRSDNANVATLQILLEKWPPVSSKWLWNCDDSCSSTVLSGATTGCSRGPNINFSTPDWEGGEDHVPGTEHEMTALMARNPTEAACISSLFTDATKSLQLESVHGHQHVR